MGYTTKDIAVIFEPKRFSLSALANFVQFQSKPRTRSKYSATINIIATPANVASTLLNITEPSGAVHSFKGTTVAAEVSGSTFFISATKSDTAENLRQALLSDAWVSANFDIKIPFLYTAGALSNGKQLTITSLGYGSEFNITITAPNNAANVAYVIAIINGVSQNGDSISGEASTIEVSLDVYTDAAVFPGADDIPNTSAKLGNFEISLSKTYSGDTLWFNVNALFSAIPEAAPPPTFPGWFDTGTLRVFRFVARIAGANNYAFYQSNALYVLPGYGLASDTIDLEDYVYANEKIKLLSNKPRTNYVRGQREYLNFLFSDIDRGSPYAENWTVYVLYRAYDTIGQFIGETESDQINRNELQMINTCILSIDDALDQFPTAGRIDVCLAREGAVISTDLEYTIRPSALHSIEQFSFLNRLGGWDSFNFDAAASEDIKVSFDTYSKTITPSYNKGLGIETVYAAQLDNTLTVVGAPVTDEVAEWLKELAASTCVLDGAGNYIIKSEFTIPVSDGSTNMQVPTMKYSLSETYTND